MAAYDAYEAYVEAKKAGDSSSVAAAKAVGAVALSANPGGKVVKALYKSAKWVKKAVSVKEKTAKVRSKVLGRGKNVAAKGERQPKYSISEQQNVSSSSQSMHKNSKHYVGDTHVYSIHRASDGKALKIGQSAQGYRKGDGASKRAEQQKRKFDKKTRERHYTKIRKEFHNKKDALQYETKFIKRTRQMYNEKSLPNNKSNH